MIERKGISPVIASVMLIVIVLVLGSVVFFWGKGFITDLEPPLLECENVNFEAGVICFFGDCALEVINRGNIELHAFEVKKIETGQIYGVGYLDEGLSIGNSKLVKLEGEYNSGDKFLIIPLIADDSGESRKCGDEYGREIIVGGGN